MLYLDTSVLIPLFLPEPDSSMVRQWFKSNSAVAMAISDWTLTEFASAMSIKVREKGLKADEADTACGLMRKLAADSLEVFIPTRQDFSKASEFLGHHALALRAGDALHLAVAHNRSVGRLYTLDKRLLAAGRKLKIKTASPV